MKILMTGIAGYIGSVCAYHFTKAGYEVIGVDDLSTGSEYAYNYLTKECGIKIYKGDFGDLKLLDVIFSENEVSCVVHFAANTSVFESTQNPLKYYDNNVANMLNLLQACKKHNINNFLFSSSAAVYGEPQTKDAITEDYHKSPINPYGTSKLIGEHILEDYAGSNSNFSYIALRYFNVAGASLEAKLGQFNSSTLLIKIAAECAVGRREKMYLYGQDYDSYDGTCIRDFIHIDDLALAHLSCFEYLQKNKTSDAFNVGYSKGASVKEVIAMMKEISSNDFCVENAERRAGDPTRLIASNKKILELTNWKPKYDDLAIICKSAYEWEKYLLDIK